ncbi:hypothetical protein FVE85_8204 [Porphyridium purpureum]|uniref:Uncharacterized protein n=1 Tax=Porphyridium purpureum TaxID=35688 RepID=A0A5J4YQM9_PORPP|nr:hypothetical protein FVE85_8204 [Porphyridium purpureum]|eukprot:POR2272..scf295_9
MKMFAPSCAVFASARQPAAHFAPAQEVHTIGDVPKRLQDRALSHTRRDYAHRYGTLVTGQVDHLRRAHEHMCCSSWMLAFSKWTADATMISHVYGVGQSGSQARC